VRQIGDQLALQGEQATTATNFVAKIKPALETGLISIAQFNAHQSQALTQQAEVRH